MMKYLALFLCVSFSASATIYQWKKANGVSVFSDKPYGNAKLVQLDKVQTYRLPNDKVNVATKAPLVEKTYYQVMVFRDSKHQQTIRNNAAIAFPIKLTIEPALRESDKVVLLLDNKPWQTKAISNTNTLHFVLKNIPRGEHYLQAQIEAKTSNNVLLASEKLTLYVQQNTVKSLLKQANS